MKVLIKGRGLNPFPILLQKGDVLYFEPYDYGNKYFRDIPKRLNFTIVQSVSFSEIIAPGLFINFVGDVWSITNVWGYEIAIEKQTEALKKRYLRERKEAKEKIKQETEFYENNL